MSLEHQNKADGQCSRGILRGGGDNTNLELNATVNVQTERRNRLAFHGSF